MSGIQLQSSSHGKLGPAVGLAMTALIAGMTDASATEHFKAAGGFAVYLGVVPAAVVRAHTRNHMEQSMHGGVPRGRDVYHVMAAVFDETTGARIDNAHVTARLIPLGLAATLRPLEPMTIAGATTYGNYFSFPGSGYYRIEVCVVPPDGTAPVTLEFAYEHRPQ